MLQWALGYIYLFQLQFFQIYAQQYFQMFLLVSLKISWIYTSSLAKWYFISYCFSASKFGKWSSSHRTRKGQFSFQPQRKTMPKNAQATTQLCSSHMLAKLCSKLSKSGFNSTWTMNFQMFKLDLEKAEEPEIKLPTSIESLKKWETSRKTSTSALLTMPQTLTMWMTINCGKFLKRWEYQTTWPASWEIFMQVRKQQLELDIEQQTGSK